MRTATLAALLLGASMNVSCSGRDDAESCFLAAGTYELKVTLVESTCDPGIIVDEWTESREVQTNALRCTERSNTTDQTITGECFEKCTQVERNDETSLSGTRSCTLSCRGTECKYTASVAAKKI